jgi:hypothetical protein
VINVCDSGTQAGDVERLAGGPKRDKPTGKSLVTNRERAVYCARVQQLAPDLVGDYEQVVTFGDVSDRRNLFCIENATGRVVRVAKEDHLGRGVDDALETRWVETPSVGIEWTVNATSATVGDGVEKRVVNRSEDNDSVTVFSRVPESDLEGVQRTGKRSNLTLVRAPAVLAFLPVGICGGQLS